MVTCGDGVVVAAAHNAVAADEATTTDGVATMDGVLVAAGAVVVVDVWVQQCWMRACTNPKSHLVSAVVKLRGKNSSWWYQQTTQGSHSTMGRLVCCQPWC